MTDKKVEKVKQYQHIAGLIVGYGIGYNKTTPYQGLKSNIESAVELAVNDISFALDSLDTDWTVEFFAQMEDALKLALKNYLDKYTDTGVIDDES